LGGWRAARAVRELACASRSRGELGFCDLRRPSRSVRGVALVLMRIGSVMLRLAAGDDERSSVCSGGGGVRFTSPKVRTRDKGAPISSL
jgi:hypothetical protein